MYQAYLDALRVGTQLEPAHFAAAGPTPVRAVQ
jgi:hypothetical protein